MKAKWRITVMPPPLQDAARLARLGLWADAAPVPPWEWRQAKGALEYRAPK